MNLQDSIRFVISSLALDKPNFITNIEQLDMLVEDDLRGKDLFDIKNKSTIKLLSGDMATFNDYAFRYYLLQFIYFYYIDEDFIMEDMFIQEFFESTILYKNSKRYLQFTSHEIEIIVDFLRQLIMKIKQTIGDIELYNKLEPWEQEEINVPFKHYESEIKQALKFWLNHPNFSR